MDRAGELSSRSGRYRLCNKRRADLVAKCVHRAAGWADKRDLLCRARERVGQLRVLRSVTPPGPHGLDARALGNINDEVHVGIVVVVGTTGHLRDGNLQYAPRPVPALGGNGASHRIASRPSLQTSMNSSARRMYSAFACTSSGVAITTKRIARSDPNISYALQGLKSGCFRVCGLRMFGGACVPRANGPDGLNSGHAIIRDQHLRRERTLAATFGSANWAGRHDERPSGASCISPFRLLVCRHGRARTRTPTRNGAATFSCSLTMSTV